PSPAPSAPQPLASLPPAPSPSAPPLPLSPPSESPRCPVRPGAAAHPPGPLSSSQLPQLLLSSSHRLISFPSISLLSKVSHLWFFFTSYNFIYTLTVWYRQANFALRKLTQDSYFLF